MSVRGESVSCRPRVSCRAANRRSSPYRPLFALLVFAGLVITGPGWAQAQRDLLKTPYIQRLPGVEPFFAERGHLIAPENRSRSDSKLVQVSYARLPSTAKQPGTPIFYLSGGPGDAIVGDFVNNDFDGDFWDPFLAMIQDFRSVADVILVGQRGAGLSVPYMGCPNQLELVSPRDYFDAQKLLEARRRYARECRTAWRTAGRDLDGYTAFELADDVNDLRLALGFDKVVLTGGSFGSQMSFTLVRRYPEMIDKLVLRGLEDTADTLDQPSGYLDAMRLILADAEKDPAIAARIPEGGILNAIEVLIKTLEAKPMDIDGMSVPLTADLVRWLWRQDPGGWRLGERMGPHLWPANLLPMFHGDFSSVARAVNALSKRAASFSDNGPVAMSSAVDCSLSPAYSVWQATLARDPAFFLIGDPELSLISVCDEWTTRRAGKDFLQRIESDIPALFFQGTTDMATPFTSNAEQIVPGYSNAYLVVVERSGHNPITDLYLERPDVVRPLILNFLREKNLAAGLKRVELPPVRFDVPDPPSASSQ